MRAATVWIGPNVAVTCWLAFIVNVQVGLLPLQPPVHAVNIELAPAVSVSVTGVPLAKLALQVAPQLIPAGLLEIVPVPVPARLTVSTLVVALALKVAATCWLALSVNVQEGLLPLQPPVHPVNVEFAPAVSVSVTEVPLAKLALQVAPQLIPAGLLAIEPVPVPARLTVSTLVPGLALKVAVTCWLALSVNVQEGLLPLQAPAHPVKVEFAPAVSVRVT